MKAHRFVLTLALIFAFTQSAAYSNCCCVTECPRTTAVEPTSDENSCCGSESTSDCTHVEAPEELLAHDAEGRIVLRLFLIAPLAHLPSSARERAGPSSELPEPDPGLPLYLRLRTFRL